MIGVYSHWVYGPHTTDGVVGSDNPLLLASNFDGTWPGLVGLLNTGACLDEPRSQAQPPVVGKGRSHDRRRVHGAARCVGAHRHDRIRRWLHSPHAARAAIGGRRQDRRRHEARSGRCDDARRYVDGHDQRLLRAATPRESRFLRAQGRSGVDHRARQAGQRGTHPRRAGLRERQRRRIPLRRRLHRRSHARATARLLRGARFAEGIPRRLHRLAVPTRTHPFAAAVGLRRRVC